MSGFTHVSDVSGFTRVADVSSFTRVADVSGFTSVAQPDFALNCRYSFHKRSHFLITSAFSTSAFKSSKFCSVICVVVYSTPARAQILLRLLSVDSDNCPIAQAVAQDPLGGLLSELF